MPWNTTKQMITSEGENSAERNKGAYEQGCLLDRQGGDADGAVLRRIERNASEVKRSRLKHQLGQRQGRFFRERVIRRGEEGGFADGFVKASMVVGIGAMAVMDPHTQITYVSRRDDSKAPALTSLCRTKPQ